MPSAKTAIEWTDKTWNPTTGCDKVNPGCKFCYAETITQRFAKSFPTGFAFTLHPDRLEEPRRWRTPSRIFVNSMSDLFHEDMPLEFLQRVFKVMREYSQHIFQVLTKRHERLISIYNNYMLLSYHSDMFVALKLHFQLHSGMGFAHSDSI